MAGEQEGDSIRLPVNKYLTREDAAAYLTISLDTLDSLGIPRSYITNKIYRYAVEDIDDWMYFRRVDCTESVSRPSKERKRTWSYTDKKRASSGTSPTQTKTEDVFGALRKLKTAV